MYILHTYILYLDSCIFCVTNVHIKVGSIFHLSQEIPLAQNNVLDMNLIGRILILSTHYINDLCILPLLY